MVKRVTVTPERTDIYFERVKIDPELAQKWLDTRELNVRNIRKGKREKFAQEMHAGRWVADNGDMIRLAPDGELLDGLHRLSAIVLGEITITLWVAFNVPKSAMPTIDTGTSRTFGDVLKFDGEKNSAAMASVTRRVLMWKMGYRLRPPSKGGIVSHSDLKDFEEKNLNELRYCTNVGIDIRAHTRFLTIASGGLLFYVTSEVDAEQGSEFKDRLIRGHGLTEGNPITVVRERLLSWNAKDLTDYEKLALCINAFNLWRREETISRIYIVYSRADRTKGTTGSLTNDNFPVPV